MSIGNRQLIRTKIEPLKWSIYKNPIILSDPSVHNRIKEMKIKNKKFDWIENMGKMVTLQSIPLISQWQLRTINKMIGSKSWQKRKQKKSSTDFQWLSMFWSGWYFYCLVYIYGSMNVCHIFWLSLPPLFHFIFILL